MGAANIRGLQSAAPAGSLGVTATVKHFAGYSQSVNGHDRNEALLPLSYLQSVILPSYAGGIDAGAGTVMVDSGSINGVPATGSHYLLTDILRHQMHFQGVVISDYQDVKRCEPTSPPLRRGVARPREPCRHGHHDQAISGSRHPADVQTGSHGPDQ
jgi:beta-glucosidase